MRMSISLIFHENEYKLSEPKLSEEDFLLASEDNDYIIRGWIAGRKDCPPNILSKLTKDDSCYVRSRVAKNRNTKKEDFWILSKDELLVRRTIACNMHAPQEILTMLAVDKDYHTRKYVAENPSTNQEILEILSKDKDEDIRYTVCHNDNVSIKTLDCLCNDESEEVSLLARKARLKCIL
jgi:hypothetical protein